MSETKTIMLQGTSSHVGKSLLCTALCRIFKQDGFQVAPFKAQNMATNSYVTGEGKEIGRAQGAQAEAAGIDADVRMNPILLKPKGDMTTQVIVMGESRGDMSVNDYHRKILPQAVDVVQRCINSLKNDFDLVVLEGAGSPAEVNLKDRDIVNMKTAELAGAPVVLVADIERGGVFAAIVGTLELLEPRERERVKGIVINKFRGDISLLQPGLEFLKRKTGLPVLGVIPYLKNHNIAQEDSVVLSEKQKTNSADIDIVVIKLPHIANFTDLDPLRKIPGVQIRLVQPGEPIGNTDAIIIPATKNTTDDLQVLWQSGTAWQILEARTTGITVVGIGGGFQILGFKLKDVEGLEGTSKGEVPGLGLLNMHTVYTTSGITCQRECNVVGKSGFWQKIAGQRLYGYEVHSGFSKYEPGVEVVLISADDVMGVAESGGNVWGTYLHGIFKNINFTLAWINQLRLRKGLAPLQLEQVQKHFASDDYDRVADVIRHHLDIEKLYQIMDDR